MSLLFIESVGRAEIGSASDGGIRWRAFIFSRQSDRDEVNSFALVFVIHIVEVHEGGTR